MIVYHETYFLPWSDTTLKYWTMLVQRYPNLNEKVGGSFPGCEISCPLDINLPDGQLPPVHWGWPVGLMSHTQIIYFYFERKQERLGVNIYNM